MAILIDGLADGWETLQLAAINKDQEVRSLVRLNKQLAYLQREGYPIPIVFRNIDMGPASFDVKTRAEVAEAQGLLQIRKTPMAEGMKDREEFVLTDAGRGYLKVQVLPAIQNHARSKLFLEVFTSVMSQVQFKKNKELVDEIHASLHLDDREELVDTYIQTKSAVDVWRAQIEESWRPKSKLDIAAASTVEFASMALDAIREGVSDERDEYTGKHNVLWNCERLVQLLQIREGLDGKNRAHENAITNGFDKVLNALEVNSAIYDILTVPDDEEIEALFREAPAYDPDEVTF